MKSTIFQRIALKFSTTAQKAFLRGVGCRFAFVNVRAGLSIFANKARGCVIARQSWYRLWRSLLLGYRG